MAGFPDLLDRLECQRELILAQQRGEIEGADLIPGVTEPIEGRVVGIDDSTFEIGDVDEGDRTVEEGVVTVLTVLQFLLRRGLLDDQRSRAAESIEHRLFIGRYGLPGEEGHDSYRLPARGSKLVSRE